MPQQTPYHQQTKQHNLEEETLNNNAVCSAGLTSFEIENHFNSLAVIKDNKYAGSHTSNNNNNNNMTIIQYIDSNNNKNNSNSNIPGPYWMTMKAMPKNNNYINPPMQARQKKTDHKKC